MMKWNHRVVLTKDAFGEKWYSIHEVYYDGKGKIMGRTVDPVAVVGNTKKELRLTLKRMLRALDEPVIKGGIKK